MKLKFKKAFTLIELIIVLVVLGIVSSMGATIISQVYMNYINQRAIHNSSLKTEIATSIIYNRLSYRISSTTVGRNLNDNNDIVLVTDIKNPENYQVLEWYGVAIDSFNANSATRRPAWNGFCDVEGSNMGVATPGSDLSLLDEVVRNTSSSSLADLAIIFNNRRYSKDVPYDISCIGYTNNNNCISKVSSVDSDMETIILANKDLKRVVEQYKLIRSAYAIVPVNERDVQTADGNTISLFDLELRYDYQPWSSNNENYFDDDTSRGILVRNVSVFKFSGMGDTLRFKICVSENIGERFITTCKEKAVIR
ncbi:hypothetical protein MNB_SV-15-1381 [hydrothermal vent metagenome]|uniref:Prepilin-type N-terminal cleavage/methylation domain-containing protein n=1 Tax=hydrothermal vent metagenome TaxID=652676 RepID=A0A1W1EI19_9ZZZZ